MQSWCATTAAATAVQKQNVSELYVVKSNTARRNQPKKTEVKAHTSPDTGVEKHLHNRRMSVLQEMQNATNVGRKVISRVAAGQKRRKRR